MLIQIRDIYKKDSEKGFTLVELIIVMAILAVLAGIAVPKFNTVLTQSRYKAHDANVDMIAHSAAIYSGAHPEITFDAAGTTVTLADLGIDANLKAPYDNTTVYTVKISPTQVIITPNKSNADFDGVTADSYTKDL